MNEPPPIDHKDDPEEYRQQVRAGVFSRVGAPGLPVTDRGRLTGNWNVYFVGLTEPHPEPVFEYRLSKDGSAVVETVGSLGDSSSGEWRLNPDGTFSLLMWCPADPDFGIPEPQLNEDRRHLAELSGGRLVIWNGDGSSVLLSPRQE